jgi:hypothetical protein
MCSATPVIFRGMISGWHGDARPLVGEEDGEKKNGRERIWVGNVKIIGTFDPMTLKGAMYVVVPGGRERAGAQTGKTRGSACTSCATMQGWVRVTESMVRVKKRVEVKKREGEGDQRKGWRGKGGCVLSVGEVTKGKSE